MRIPISLHTVPFLVIAVIVAACTPSIDQPLFTLVPSDHSTLAFNNTIRESDSLNILTFEYIYNGGGVGIGDVNNDGLQDILFTGNMVTSRLYLNRGDLKFEDVTGVAGVTTTQWCTGVSMIDINQDGLLDMYISTATVGNQATPNQLFINQGVRDGGIPFFKELGSSVGLADTSYCVQSAFLDYDLDGDLDVYLLTNHIEKYNRNTPYGQRHDGTGNSVDKLFRNEGIVDGSPRYKDVSRDAGILSDGWGLGIVINDINRDGYPDIYVANDFMANDHLYINNRNGTYTNAIDQYLKHQEHDGMGVDIADINNDALNDIIALDMMPEDNVRQKAMFSNNPYDRFQLNLRKGYQHQYVRNVLQLNNGNHTFSDIGYLAGVYATDWSWSALMADVDNDTYRDLFITNGFRKDITNLDFVSYSNEAKRFGTAEGKLKRARAEVERLEGVKKPNCLFRNNGDLTFTDNASSWGLTDASYSTGAAYADLDNDGDLDLIVNNVNAAATLYENHIDRNRDDAHYLRIEFVGKKGNRAGLGAKIRAFADGKTFYIEHQLQRGYQSSIDPIGHLGLGKGAVIDSVEITWQSGAIQKFTHVAADQQLIVYEDSANYDLPFAVTTLPMGTVPVRTTTAKSTDAKSQQARTVPAAFFKETASAHNINLVAAESEYVDYKQGQPLLLHKYSQEGPGVAVGDVNGDGLEDFVVGGSAHHAAQIYLQQATGTFTADSLPSKLSEDMGLLLFDADGDRDLDLYCVSGSTEFGKDTALYQDRLYGNDGNGNFVLRENVLPRMTAAGSCAVASDFDRDGDLDLFVGGRVVPGRFPEAPRSFLLQNDGKGNFEDVTRQLSQALEYPGLITSALWTDVDNDGWMDLAVGGEWMPVTFYRNVQGRAFEEMYSSASGWWNSISGGDFDNDGDTDYVLGNLGLNSLFKASDREPVTLYAQDFDDNGSIDPIVTRYIQGIERPTHYRESMTEQMVSMRRKLQTYADYGNALITDLLSADGLRNARILKVNCLTSSLLINDGGGKFDLRPLPMQAQFAPVYGSAVTDVNKDGHADIIGIGNSYSTETSAGYYDAGIGFCLLGDGRGNFSPAKPNVSGFFADKDAKGLALVNLASGNQLWIVTNNQDRVQAFESTPGNGEVIKLLPDDVAVEITLSSGSIQRRELYYGSGYLSQGSRNFTLPPGTRSYVVINAKGKRRSVKMSWPSRSRH